MGLPNTRRQWPEAVVITGLGMVTPLGSRPEEILGRIETGFSAAAPPEHFDANPFACPVCAAIKDFRPQDYIAEAKLIRLMNRDAQLAVAAAHLALKDAGVPAGNYYAPEDIGLYGATGLAGLPFHEIAPLVKASADAEGRFDLQRFGAAGLRTVSPILSFKILSNMPVCFVSICENIQGANAIYTPWEGQGAQAIEAGIFALQSGDARCVLVGGCDVKTHELAFLTLEQMGLFQSWRESGIGLVPGEGAIYLVLERESLARERGASIYARIGDWSLMVKSCVKPHALPPHPGPQAVEESQAVSRTTGTTVLAEDRLPHSLSLGRGQGEGDQAVSQTNHVTAEMIVNTIGILCREKPTAVIAAANGDPELEKSELLALAHIRLVPSLRLSPKKCAGDLFAAAAPLQVAMGALAARRHDRAVLANCFGYGGVQAAFMLEPT